MEDSVNDMIHEIGTEFLKKSKPKIGLAWITFLAFALIIQLGSTEPLTGEGLEDIVPQKVVTHYDCERPEETILYSTTEVPDCKLDLEDVKYSKAQIVTYYRSFAKRIEGWQCSVSYQHERWYCGVGSNTGMDASHVSITTPLLITGEQCKAVIPQSKNEVTILNYKGLWGESIMKIQFQEDILKHTGMTFGQKIKEASTAKIAKDGVM